MTNKTLRLSGGNRWIIQLGVLAQKLFKNLKKYFKSQSFLKKKTKQYLKLTHTAVFLP